MAEHRALTSADVERGLVLLGLGLIDPPREEAIEAIARMQGAGITVKMITGIILKPRARSPAS